MAKDAVAAGEVDQFLASLDNRASATEGYGPLFKTFAWEWFETCVEDSSLTESEQDTTRFTIKNHLVPEFGKLPIGEIDTRRIDRFKSKKRKQRHQYGTGYSAKSINNMLSVLHRVFDKAIEYSMIEHNPVTTRSWMKVDSSESSRPWWTPDEEAKAFAVLESWKESDPTARITILTQLMTGIRFSELRALRKEDLDLQIPALHIRRSQARRMVGPTKNKKARIQVIPQALADELREHMLRIPGQLLFPGRTGGALANNVLNRLYTKLCDEAEITRITSHGVRHTAGSSYAYLGAGNKSIATLLGHENMASSERYTHMRADGTPDLVAARWARLSGEKDQ